MQTSRSFRRIKEKLKERGCWPFVTDTTTMPYHPWISLALAVDHLETANPNGFNRSSMGCPVIIADGWVGTDDVIVDLIGRGSYLNKQFVARAIADADALLSVAHFKGHPAGGSGVYCFACANLCVNMSGIGAPLIQPGHRLFRPPHRGCNYPEASQEVA